MKLNIGSFGTVLAASAAASVASAVVVGDLSLSQAAYTPGHPLIRSIEARQTTAPNEFCRWWGHQSLSLGNKVFVDGGLRTFRESYKDGTLYVYFSVSSLDYTRGVVFPVKQSSREWSTGVVPNAQGEATQQGALFTDGGNSIYKYGGWFADNNTWAKVPQAQVRQAQMWRYDLQSSKWDEAQLSGDKISRAFGGAYVSVPETKRAYFLGGVVSRDTDSAFATLPGELILGDSFLTLDTDRVTWKNVTGITGAEPGPHAMANVVHIGALGKDNKGVLVLLGGITAPTGTLVTNANAPKVLSPRPLDKIHVYDIATSRWYVQKTGGTPPPSRIGACSVVVPSSDGTSYNIFVYGGSVPQSGITFGDTWVLSLPSFQWAKVDDSGEKKYMHTCHVVKDSKMLVIGGKDLVQDDQGNPALNYTTDGSKWTCDGGGVFSAFDLNKFAWLPAGIAEQADPYSVADAITTLIGGTARGNATVLSPPGGWDDSALGTIMHITASNTGGDPTPPAGDKDKKGAPIGAIVGGAVGGVVVLALIAVGVFLCLRKQRRTEADKAAAAGLVNPPAQGQADAGAGLAAPLAYQDPRNSLLSNAPPYPGSPAPYWAASPPPHVDQQNQYYAQQQQQQYPYGQQPQAAPQPGQPQQFPYPQLGQQIAEVSGDSSYYSPAKQGENAAGAAGGTELPGASAAGHGTAKPASQPHIAQELQ